MIVKSCNLLKIIVISAMGLAWLSPVTARANDGNGWLFGVGLQQTKAHVITTSPLGDYDSRDATVKSYVDARYRFVLKKPFEMQLAMTVSPGTRSAGGFLASGSYSFKDTMSMTVAPGIRLNERTLLVGVLSVDRSRLQFAQRNIARGASVDGRGVGVGIQYDLTSDWIAEIIYKEVRFDTARTLFEADLKTKNILFGLLYRF